MFDYRGGGNGLDGNYFQCSSSPKACQETQDPSAPLWMQARAIAETYGTTYYPPGQTTGGTNYKSALGYFMSNQFWKFREFAAIYQLPTRLNNYLRASPGSTVVFSARNLRTWSNFTGVDPEENYGVSGSEVANDFNTSPPPTYFTFRLNLKY